MNEPNHNMTRREALKRAGLVGLGGLAGAILPRHLAAAEGEPPAPPPLPRVPRRVLGKTGQEVPILLMGMAMNFDPKFDPRLAECLRFGVNYFDCADCYAGGTSETACGNFLEATGKRNEVWITTKSCNHTPDGIVKVLATSLQRLKTDHVELLFLHGLKDPRFLSPDMARTADQLKREGKIRFFGFSCHDSNVADLLQRAAALDYIDVIMFRYNFREYGNRELNDAMDACHKARIGLIAMKTQGSAVSFQDRIEKIDGSRFSRAQAVLKAVWADERITAAVSHMDTLEKIKENVAAALDRSKFTDAEREALARYDRATAHHYCAGCQHLCGQAVPAGIEVGTTLRYLMYHDAYGDPQTARALFARLPEAARRIAEVDFHRAAALCPRHVDIVAHMRRAAGVLV